MSSYYESLSLSLACFFPSSSRRPSARSRIKIAISRYLSARSRSEGGREGGVKNSILTEFVAAPRETNCRALPVCSGFLFLCVCAFFVFKSERRPRATVKPPRKVGKARVDVRGHPRTHTHTHIYIIMFRFTRGESRIVVGTRVGISRPAGGGEGSGVSLPPFSRSESSIDIDHWKTTSTHLFARNFAVLDLPLTCGPRCKKQR